MFLKNVSIKQDFKNFLAKIYYPFYRLSKIADQQPKLIILMYHSVNPKHPDSILPINFEEQIKWLKENYQIVRLSNFPNFIKDSVAITFDDGFEDNFFYAYPILKKYNCPATIFIITGFITKEIDITKGWQNYKGLSPLSPEQILEMLNSGLIDFGVHSHTHPILSKISEEGAEEEIIRSKEILEKILNKQIDIFAYPFGQIKDFNKKIILKLKNYNFKLACSTIWGRNTKSTNPFILHRIRIDRQDTFDDFRDKVLGYWDFIKWLHYFKKFL